MKRKYDLMGAAFSPDRLYRYRLTRRWREGPRACFIMLNPSTADGEQDDPTIRRCVGYADANGCGRLEVVNLFARRSSDPDLLLIGKREDAIGAGNDESILSAAQLADWVICAWGCHPAAAGPTGTPHDGRGDVVATMLLAAGIQLRALRETEKGFPAHPLYLPHELTLQPFHPTRRVS